MMNLTISRKIALGFGLFIAVVLGIMIFARVALKESISVNKQMTLAHWLLTVAQQQDMLLTH